jgi:hypothetical protein
MLPVSRLKDERHSPLPPRAEQNCVDRHAFVRNDPIRGLRCSSHGDGV